VTKSRVTHAHRYGEAVVDRARARQAGRQAGGQASGGQQRDKSWKGEVGK
jgi:general stress protein YciG